MQRVSQSLTITKRINAERANALRKTYESLMDEERRRKDRNEQIIGILDKMRMSNTVALRNPLPRYYEDYQQRNTSPTSHLSDDLRRQKFNETNHPRPLVPAIINNMNEDIILKEMSKKYIIIPKLRNANITLQYDRAVESISPITTSNYDSDDWKRKYEILNQIKTENEANDTNPYVMEAERDEKNKDDELTQNTKYNEESEYSTVAKLVANAKHTKVINNESLTNLATEFAEITTANNDTFAEKLENEQINRVEPFVEESNQDEAIYANVATANLKTNMTYDYKKQCTEYKSPDNVTIDPQKPEPKTFDDQEEEVNEIESNLRFNIEDTIPKNNNIAPVSVSQYNEDSNNTADLEKYDQGENPEDLVTYEAPTNEYQNSEITTETQNFEAIPNENYEIQPTEQSPEASEYQNDNVSDSTHYQNEVRPVEDNQNYEVQPTVYENYDITNQNSEAPENQYQNYGIQQDGSGNNYSSEYQVYDPDLSTLEQSQIDEFNEENNTMFYSENIEEPVYQPQELQQQQQQTAYEQNQYVFETENETMQPYDQSYEQQYSGLAYDATQEVPNAINQSDYGNTAYADYTVAETPNQDTAFTDYSVAETPNELYVEQVKVELDAEDGLIVPNQPAI